jgi:predicted flavoprotein YhiN
MTLKEQITEDMKTAMRAKDSERLATIRLLLAAMKQKEVDERVELDDAMVVAIVDKMVKQRKDSITQFTAGGVDTRDLSSQTMESKQPGLYFIGEVVDVTGWLGGYNFQWAWASAHACAEALSLKCKAQAIMTG